MRITLKLCKHSAQQRKTIFFWDCKVKQYILEEFITNVIDFYWDCKVKQYILEFITNVKHQVLSHLPLKGIDPIYNIHQQTYL